MDTEDSKSSSEDNLEIDESRDSDRNTEEKSSDEETKNSPFESELAEKGCEKEEESNHEEVVEDEHMSHPGEDMYTSEEKTEEVNRSELQFDLEKTEGKRVEDVQMEKDTDIDAVVDLQNEKMDDEREGLDFEDGSDGETVEDLKLQNPELHLKETCSRKRSSSLSSDEPVEKRFKESLHKVENVENDLSVDSKEESDDKSGLPDSIESDLDIDVALQSETGSLSTSGEDYSTQNGTAHMPKDQTNDSAKSNDLCSVNVYKTMNGHKSDDDQSTGKSEDSEKENRQLDDMPIDLTTKSSSSSINGPDMFMLSDEDDMDEKMNDVIFREPLQEEVMRRKKIIKRFQAELRNEEAKLVLLRKLRQSQLSHQLHEQNAVNNNKPQSGPRQNSQPPPLIRGNQHPVQAKPAHSQPPQLIHGQVQQSRNQIHGPPPLVNMSQRMDSQQIMMGMHGNMMAGGAAPNLMAGFRSVQNHTQQPPPPETQTPAQRQAVAKLALRKQLEKTLLQIPPPKPPPPEMNFIPGLTMPDFICLLGLEEVVNYILDADLIAKGEKSADEKMVCNPFTCCQCDSDFTPVWKREKPGSKNVVCELCVTTNQKKALKQEHTNRLKSAFVKALQQEQEIERMQAQVTTPCTTTTASNPPNVTTAPMNLTSTPYKPAADPLRQHQNLIHAHQASLRMGQPLGLQPFGASRGPFPYQLPFGPKHSDIQRQYLLDMIPNTRGAMPWKT